MKKIRNIITKRLKNNKGENAIIYVFGILLIYSLMMFFTDLFRLSFARINNTKAVEDITQTAIVQGGFSSIKPSRYEGDYTTTTMLAEYVRRNIGTPVINPDYILTVEGIGESGSIEQLIITKDDVTNRDFKFDEGKKITITLKYKFSLMSMPKDSSLRTIPFDVTRIVSSEYKHKSWI